LCKGHGFSRESINPVKPSKLKYGSVLKISRLAYCNAFVLAVAALIFPATRSYPQQDVPAITIHARRYEFVPSSITLTAGKPVRLIFISDDVAHGIAIDGLFTDRNIDPGKPAVITVTPSTVGDFPGVCSRYCGAGHERMKFLVHVVQ